MLVKHTLAMTALCPVDGKQDAYTVMVECNRIIKVEDILAACARFQQEALFQEQITQELSHILDAKVTTTGLHSGVATVCACS